MIDGYDRCRQRKLPSMPNHERNHYHSDNFTKRPTSRYELRERWSLEHGLGSRDMETGSLWMFSCFSLLFFSYLDHGPVQMASAWVFTTSQCRWSFPVHRIRRKVTIELYRSVVGLMGSYDCVRRMIVSFFVSLSFPFLLYGLCSPGGLRLKRGIL